MQRTLFQLPNAWSRPFSQMLAVLVLAASAVGCDVISEPVLPTLTSTLTPREQQSIDSVEALHPAPANLQRVLIEDFTGQRCGNCPNAARKADSLRRAHPDQVLILETHVTDFFSAPQQPSFPIDFRVPGVSQEIATTYDLDNRGLPQGAVNRSPFAAANNDPVANFMLWPAATTAQLNRSPEQELLITSQYDTATHILRLKITSRYLTSKTGPYRLGIVITEDSLAGNQIDYHPPAGTVQLPGTRQITPNFMHRHVLRAVLAGTFGTEQVKNPFAGQRFINYLSYKLAPTWVAKHCGVIAYISNGTTRQIVQVAGVEVMH